MDTFLSYNGLRIYEVPTEGRNLGGRGATPGAVYPLVIRPDDRREESAAGQGGRRPTQSC